MKAYLKNFTVNYFRYYPCKDGNEDAHSIATRKIIRARSFEDAWARWDKQNPCGDIYRWATSIEDEDGNMDCR